MPKLLINEGGQASVFELLDDEATIGRGASNAVQIADSHASKHHAVVRRLHGRIKLVDLESKNGTRVNGEFRNQRWLQHGDAISIGSAVMTFDASDAAAAVATAPAHAHPAGVDPLAATLPSTAAASYPAPVSRAARARARARDEEGDDEDRPRRPARRSGNSTGVALLVGGGLIGVVALFFLLLSGKGNPPNTQALQYARDLSTRGGKENVQAALDYLTQHGDPSDVDTYVSVNKEIIALKEKLLSFDDTDLEEAAAKEYKALERMYIEKHKNGRTDEQIGQDLVKWVNTYKQVGTAPNKVPGRTVGAFLAGYKDPYLLKLYKKTIEGGAAPPK